MRLIHLSDLHFGALDPRLPDVLREAVTSLRPDHIVVSGDQSQRGTRAELELAAEYLRSLRQPLFIVPGNHDLPRGMQILDRFLKPWDTYRSIYGAELDPVFQSDEYVLIGANSARVGGWYLDWSRGHISMEQLARIEALCARLPPELLRILVVHHPPAAPPYGTRRHLIRRRPRMFAALNRAGIDLIMSGHFHHSYALPIHLTRDKSRQCVLSVAPSGTSHRLHGEPNGFHVIDGSASELKVESHGWDGQRYTCAREWRLVRDSARNWQSV